MGNYNWDNPTPNAQMSGSADETLLKINTVMPARIVTFDAKTQLATVQPLIDMVMKDGTTKPYPVIASVPVEFPYGGGFFLTFPVSSGDDCELTINQRCINGYLQTGEQRPPEEYRMFHLSDAVARVGIRPQSRILSEFAEDAVEIRNENKSTAFRITKKEEIEMHLLIPDKEIDTKIRINSKGEIVLRAPVIRMVGTVTNEDEQE